MKTKQLAMKIFAVLMAAMMLFGVAAPVISAATWTTENGHHEHFTKDENGNKDDRPINYVSIGDSMANGYGFEGYYQDVHDLAKYDFMTGEGMYGEGAYPLQFEEYLASKVGEDNVNHTKLAASGMMAEDLLFLLDGREEFDDGWAGFKHYIGDYANDIPAVKAHVQKAIKEADIITMGIGNASFGAFLMDRVTNTIGIMGSSGNISEQLTLENALLLLEDEGLKADLMEWYAGFAAEALPVLEEALPETDADTRQAVLDVVAYTVASFMVNYRELMKTILEMNPDVEIILVGLMNTTSGMNIVDDKGNIIAELGNTMDEMFNLLNTYVCAIPTMMKTEYKDAHLCFAEQPTPDFICNVFDDLYREGWNNIDCGDAECVDCTDGDPETNCGKGRLSGTVVRQRNVNAYNGGLRQMIGSALGMDLPAIDLADVQNYVFVGDELDSYRIIAEFKAQIGEYQNGADESKWPLVKRYISAAEDAYLAQAEAKAGEVFAAEIAKEISIAIYLAIEEAVINSIDTMNLTMAGLQGIAGNVFGALGEMPEDLNPENNPGPVKIKKALVGWFSNGNGPAMCKVYALFKVGDGMSVHPTPKGHDAIAARVIAAYENGTTVSEKTIKEFYNFLKYDTSMNSAAKVSLIKDVYAAMSGELSDYPEVAVAVRIHDTLDGKGLISADHTMDIILHVYEAMVYAPAEEGAVELNIQLIYNHLLPADMSDEDKLAVIWDIYYILKSETSYLDEYKAALSIVEKLYNALEAYLTPAKSFAIVDYVFNCAIDGNVDGAEIVAIVDYIYNTVFALAPAQMARGNGAEGLGGLTPADKLEIIGIVLTVLENDETIKADADVVEVLSSANNIYTTLKDHGDVSDEALMEVVDTMFTTVVEKVEDGVVTEDKIAEITSSVTTQIMESPTIPAAAKMTIVVTVTDALKDTNLGGEGSTPVIPGLDVIQALREALKGYVTDAEAVNIINAILPLLTGNDVDMIKLADTIYLNLLGGHSAEEQVEILYVVYTVLDEYGYVEMGVVNAYGYAYNLAYANGYIKEAIKYLGYAVDGVNTAYNYVNGYYVDSEFAGIKAELLKELQNTEKTLDALKQALANDRFATLEKAIVTIMSYEKDLWNHLATLQALAEECGIVITPYVQELIKAVNSYSALVAEIVEDAYNYAVETYEGFVQGYANFVELAGSYADKIDKRLGAAVRKYLTETPADAFAIIYAYGEDAILTLIGKAAAAADDIYVKAAALVAILAEHGTDIYDAVVGTDEFDALLDEINKTKDELIAHYNKIMKAPFENIIDYEDDLKVLERELNDLYGRVYALVDASLDKIDPHVKEMLCASFGALLDSVGILGEAGSDYLVYLDDATKAMVGKLLTSFLENTMELGEVTDIVIRDLLNQLYNFLVKTANDINAYLQAQLAILEAELERLYGELMNAVNELKEEILAKIAEIQAKIDELKALIQDGIEDVKALIAEIKALLSDVQALIEMLKNNLDISLDSLKDLLDTLKKLDEFLSSVFGEGYEELKALLHELALELLDRLLDALKEASPYIDAYLYDYFYNNPEEVIAFFTTHGPCIEAILDEYGDEMLGVIAYLLYTYGPDAVEYALENPEETFEMISAWYDKYGYRIWPMVQVYLDALGIEYYTIDDITEALNKLYAMAEKLGIQLNEYVKGELLPAIRELQAQIKAQLEYIANVAPEYIEAALEELKALVDELKAQLLAIVEDAMNGEYTVTEDSYVTVIGGSYGELLAEALGLTNKYNGMTWDAIDPDVLAGSDFVVLGYDEAKINGFTRAQMLAFIYGYVNETLKDDVIDYLWAVLDDPDYTDDKDDGILYPEDIEALVGELTVAMDDALAALVGDNKTVVSMDWAALVGEENVAAVNEILDRIAELLDEKGIDGVMTVDIDVVPLLADATGLKETFLRDALKENAIFTLELPVGELVMLALESYLYSNISFQKDYAETILDLVAANPNVTIAVLGQYNPFANYGELPLADAYELIADMASAHSFAYAVALPNVTYVDISGAETVAPDADLLTFVMAYLSDSEALALTEAGKQYVVDQILAAYGLTAVPGHEHEYTAVVTAPTCTEQGYTTYTCACGDSYVADYVDALGHAYEAVVTDPTCTEKGYTTYTCPVCGDSYVDDYTDMIPHDYEAVVTAPTCTDKGYTTYTCKVCGHSYVGDEVDALGHDYEAVVTAPTCTDKGYTTYTCKNCGDSYVGDEVDALGHTWVDADCENPKTCSVCGETEGEALGHDWADADCENPKTCKRCGATEGEALGHDWAAADCDTPKTCKRCGATEGEALGHTYDNACDADCNVCGATRTPADHEFGDWYVVTEATEDAEGTEERKCAVCGHTETRSIPKLEKSGMGAGAVVGIVFGSVAVVSAGAAAVLFILKKKRIFG